jgi:hypothetical protein
VKLPFLALKLFFTRPKMLLLGFFPGAFTFALSIAAVYGLWSVFLVGVTLWVSIPSMMLAFLIFWLLFGNLSLIPVEDSLVDQVQIARWGEVRIPAPPMSFNRIAREALYSIFIAGAAILLFGLSFIAILAPINFILAAWLCAYGFLGAAYVRKTNTARERVALFFSDWFPNLLLGAFLNVLLFIPVLNVFLLGYAQILAALLFVERENLRSSVNIDRK